MKCRVHPLAELEATEAALWYDDRRQGLGDEFLAEVEEAFRQIENSVDSLPRAEWYAGSLDIRRYRLSRFPYILIFHRRPTEAVVLAVSHVRRRPLYWLDRLSGESG